MQELVEILDNECAVYDKYLQVAAKKKEALMKNNLDALTKITEMEKKLSTKILKLESQRKTLFRQEGFAANIKVGELLEQLESQAGNLRLRNDLEQAATKLKEVLTECKRFNDSNMALMRQSSKYINHMIKVFTQNDKTRQAATYSKNNVNKQMSNMRIADAQG